MGLCTTCVRRVGARLGTVAWSVERESPRPVSSYRVVARGASCQGQPRPLLPLPTASPRRKSDCQRRHEHKAFSTLQNGYFWYISLCSRIFLLSGRALLWRSGAKVKPLRIAITPTPPPSLFLFFFSELFCAVPLESAGCNYVHVN
jgi:hypothetical protein